MLVAIKIKYIVVGPNGPEISHVYLSEITETGNEMSGANMEGIPDILEAEILDLSTEEGRKKLCWAYDRKQVDPIDILNMDPGAEGSMTCIGIETVPIEMEGHTKVFIDELEKKREEWGQKHRTTCLLEKELAAALTKLSELLPDQTNPEKFRTMKFEEIYALPNEERILALAALEKVDKWKVRKLHEECMKPENHEVYLEASGVGPAFRSACRGAAESILKKLA